jgi:hypothetical protein
MSILFFTLIYAASPCPTSQNTIVVRRSKYELQKDIKTIIAEKREI